jgi:hypothetical protein
MDVAGRRNKSSLFMISPDAARIRATGSRFQRVKWITLYSSPNVPRTVLYSSCLGLVGSAVRVFSTSHTVPYQTRFVQPLDGWTMRFWLRYSTICLCSCTATYCTVLYLGVKSVCASRTNRSLTPEGYFRIHPQCKRSVSYPQSTPECQSTVLPVLVQY